MTSSLAMYWIRLFCFFAALNMSAVVLAEETSTLFRINAQQLQNQLSSPDLVIIDARSPASYAQNHIPGALNFPEPDTYANKALNGRIISPHPMQEKMRSLGLTTEHEIIVYDNGALMAAARVFWALEVYGFKNVKILNQGFDGWSQRGFAISQDLPTTTASDYIASINHNRLATKLKTQIASHSPKQVIIDARPNPAYIGEKSSAKRFGHIPTALNIPADHNLEGTDSLKSLQPLHELKKLYADIPKDKKVVIYCAIGRISSTNYLVLRELGYDVSNYDASWKEWGNDFSLPISK